MNDTNETDPSGAERLFDLPPARATGLLILLCLVLFLPGFFSLPPVDRDEVRFAQASKQMVESGDFIDIRLGERPRYKKPAGIYWLQAGAYALAGESHRHDIWVFRLPSLIAATGAVLLTYLFGLALAGRRAGAIAAMLLASSFLLGAEARLAKTDATLLLTIIAAQYALGRLFIRGGAGAGMVALFWAALGASVMIKGPVGPMVTGFTILALIALTRSTRWLAPLFRLRDIALFLAIALPWYVLIHLRAGDLFWQESLGRDMAAKLASAQESHGAPPGSYLLAFWATFFPGSLFLIPVLGRIWRMRRDRAVMFLLSWILPAWIMFEMVPTKLVHYVLPTYPAIALLIGLGWAREAMPAPGRGVRIVMLALLLIPLLLIGAITLEAPKYGGRPFTLLASLAALLLLVPFLAMLIWRARFWHALLLAPALSLALSIGIYPTLARLPGLWPGKAAAGIINAYEACPSPGLAAYGYHEASLMFLTDSRLKHAPGPEAIDPDCAVVVVESRAEPDWRKVVAELGVEFRALGRAEGLNLATGKPVRLTIYARP